MAYNSDTVTGSSKVLEPKV